MHLVEIPLDQLKPADWNPNWLSPFMHSKLKASLKRYGNVRALVVRPSPLGNYEIMAGNSLYSLLLELGYTSAPCLVLNLSDAEARLLSLALNNIRGEEDLGLKAEAVRVILQSIPPEEVMAVLPESSQGLQALASLGHVDMASYIQAWQKTKAARLHHLTLQFTKEQLPLVEEALKLALLEVKGEGEGPNIRGAAMATICSFYLQQKGAVLYT